MPTQGRRARQLAAGHVRPTAAEIEANPARAPFHADLPLVRPRTAAQDRAHRSEQSEAQRNRARIAERPNLP